MGQNQLEVEGVLKGYFLSSTGTLSVYEIPFCFPVKAYNVSLPSRLYPVWSHYYLKVRIKAMSSKQEIQRLQIQVGDRKWRITFKEPTKQVAIPESPDEWLTVHAKTGLSIK